MITDCIESFCYGMVSILLLCLIGLCCTMVYDRYCIIHKSSFLVITDREELEHESNYPKRLLNETNQWICIVCMESIIDSTIPVIECTYCHKYISHIHCFTPYIIRYNTCMYCRK
jgi:hypothetical protein